MLTVGADTAIESQEALVHAGTMKSSKQGRCPQPVVLRNETCLYCGKALDRATSTREHVVGRCFVPRGALQESWNLIAKACEGCNGRKSTLEDDISAITMQPTVTGTFAVADLRLHAEAERKASNSISRRTKKPVGESRETFEVTTPFMGRSTATFGMIAPPQIDSDRAAALAQFHIGAFFYYITYNSETRRGGFCDGVFSHFPPAFRNDWGNALLRSFMAIVTPWPHRFVFTGASGYFKAAIRRHPTTPCWSWSLEWNQSLRLVGFMGDESPIQAITNSLIFDEFRSGNEEFRFRPEVSLAETDDVLFHIPE